MNKFNDQMQRVNGEVCDLAGNPLNDWLFEQDGDMFYIAKSERGECVCLEELPKTVMTVILEDMCKNMNIEYNVLNCNAIANGLETNPNFQVEKQND